MNMHVRLGIICVIIHHCSLFRAAENRSVSAQNGNYIPGYCYGASVLQKKGSEVPTFAASPRNKTRRNQNIAVSEVVIIIGFTSSLMLHLYAMLEASEKQSYEKPVKCLFKIRR